MAELTNTLRKLVRSLTEAKHRRREGLFIIEGTKCIIDTVPSFACAYIFARPSWISENAAFVSGLATTDIIPCSSADLERMTALTTAPQAIAVCRIPEQMPLASEDFAHKLVVALDRVQDPGNLGTIIRLCDWMGVSDILASHDTADVWSPKVVQATMGALSRVRIHYCDLSEILGSWPSDVYGTFLDAPSIYDATLSPEGVIVLGNEGRGISDQVAAKVTSRLYIPSFPPGRQTSESLNVATAAAITLAEFRSRQLRQRN